MIDYAILDTNFLLNPTELFINTLFIPFPIINEFKTQQFLENFKSLKQKYKIIYTHNKLLPKTNLLDNTDELFIVDTKYYTFTDYLCRNLKVLCSIEDQHVIATTLYVESIHNQNDSLFNLIFYFKNHSDLETYLKAVENSDFYEWKSFHNTTQQHRKTVCLTRDAGINTVLSYLKLRHLITFEENFVEKKFVLRCFTCKRIYKTERLFCVKCGNQTITRVSVRRDDENRLVVNLKKGFKFKPKIVRDGNGKEILSEDSRQWNQINRKK